MPTQSINLKSSFIQALEYDRETRTAIVQFKRGAIYRYAQVPPVTFTRWLKAPSKGRYFHRNIRNRFNYKRIS